MLNVMIVDDFRIFINRLRRLDVWNKYSDTFKLKYLITDSNQALEILRKDHVDLLITDLKMPDISGMELLKYVRDEKLCRCSIILSEYAEFEYAHEAILLGVFDYLIKPLSESMLGSVLERAAKYLIENPDVQDDDIINSSIESVCSSILKVNDDIRSKTQKLISDCSRKSGENITRFTMNLSSSFSEIYSRIKNIYPWIENITNDPKRAECLILESDTKQDAEEQFMKLCTDIFNAVKTFYPPDLSELIRDVANYILLNYSQKLTLSEVADACFVNRTHLSHIFKINMGISFVDYIVRYKMTILMMMITDNELTINEMADKLGYEDSKYMSRLFKNTFGITISDFKKEYLIRTYNCKTTQ